MQASDYLKMKFQSDRQLTIYGQQGVAGTWRALKDRLWYLLRNWACKLVLIMLNPQLSRCMWRASLRRKRMYLSILSLYRYRDVIAHMLYLYFERVISDSENGNEHNRVRKIDSKVTGLVNNIPTSKAARLAIAWGLAKSCPNQACCLKSSSNGLHAAYLTLSWRFNWLERNRSALLLLAAWKHWTLSITPPSMPHNWRCFTTFWAFPVWTH